eukprot:CAMPEP_0119287068 /NCGR_PEP_ID=MMETSP1329-20130426/34940_1 /TAXON_ID=114041 /ORGANISM="Genus nov. species nov., Strain RCC1024" /LENGTH=186 /DNA_ID=CAMNT_0007287821 /DNA_START=178 /DNA_END=734 /DNA_ORIENTATION=-
MAKLILLAAAANALLLPGRPRACVKPLAATQGMRGIGTILDDFKASQLKTLDTDRPVFSAGDQVVVACEITEGNTKRIQNYQGLVIKRSGGGLTQTFTVRKMSSGVGVERTFPLYSPTVKSIKVVKRGSVRRSKLYYLRELTGKSARIKEKVRGLNYVLKLEEQAAAAKAEEARLAEEAAAAEAAA